MTDRTHIRLHIACLADPGIFVAQLDAATGELSDLRPASDRRATGWMVHRNGHILTVEELDPSDAPRLSLLAISSDGALTPRWQRPTRLDHACHLALSPTGEHLAIAEYMGGAITLLPIVHGVPDVDAGRRFVRHGSGPDSARQDSSHVHCVGFVGDGRSLMAADLGTDTIVRFDGPEFAAETVFHAVAGSGPRHFALGPKAALYVIGELDGSLQVFDLDAPKDGPRQHLSLMQAEHVGPPAASALKVSPDGRFVVAVERTSGVIAWFAIDQKSGALSPAGTCMSTAQSARDLAFTHDGRFAVVADQTGDAVLSYRIDPGTGAMAPIAQLSGLPSPCAILDTSLYE